MYIPDMKDIKEIAEFLVNTNISELSLKIGVSRFTLHKIKNGYKYATVRTLEKLTDYMDQDMKNGIVRQNEEGEWYIDYGSIASPPFKTEQEAIDTRKRADKFCTPYECKDNK